MDGWMDCFTEFIVWSFIFILVYFLFLWYFSFIWFILFFIVVYF